MRRDPRGVKNTKILLARAENGGYFNPKVELPVDHDRTTLAQLLQKHDLAQSQSMRSNFDANTTQGSLKRPPDFNLIQNSTGSDFGSRFRVKGVIDQSMNGAQMPTDNMKAAK